MNNKENNITKIFDKAAISISEERKILRNAILENFSNEEELEINKVRSQRIKSELGNFGLQTDSVDDKKYVQNSLKEDFLLYNNQKKIHSALLFKDESISDSMTHFFYSNPEAVKDIIKLDIHSIIEKRILLFQDIPSSFDDRSIQRILREIDADQIAKAIINQTYIVKQKFLGNMSERATKDIVTRMKSFVPEISDEEIFDNQIAIIKVILKLIKDEEIYPYGKFANETEQY